MTTLLQQMQEMSTEPAMPLSALLRKAMILAKRLSYRPLSEWAQHELQGYPEDVDLPSYRARRRCQVLGKFEAGLGNGFVNPVPSANVEDQHREGLFSFELRLGVARYEDLIEAGDVEIPWDQNYVLHYRDSFYPDFALERAWRSVSTSELVQMLDAVRTRLLDFVLEIEELDPEAGDAAPGVQPIAPNQVTQVFNQTFYGDNTAVAAAGHTVHQNQTASVDIEAVRQIADAFGIVEADREALVAAIQEDGGLAGERTRVWIDRLKAGGITVGTDVAAQTAAAALLGVLGLS
jgi:hypothetical protein